MWRKCIGILGIFALAAIIFTSSSYVFADAEDDTSGAIPDTTLYDKNGITIELIQFEGTIGIYDTDSESHLKQHLQVKMDDVLVPASSYRITGIPGVGAEGFHALSVDISSGNRLISCPISLEFIVNQIVSVEVDVGTGLTINSNTEYDDLKYELLAHIKIIRTDGSVISPTLDEFTIEGSLIAGVGDNPEPRTLTVFVTMGGVTKERSFNVDIVPIKPVSISVVDGPSYGLIANTDYIPETIRVKFEDNTTKDVMDFLKNLRIPLEDKKKLLLGISAIMVNVGEDSTKMATAACMGYSVEDEMFVAFYNTEIKPIVNLDIQTIYDQLSAKVITEDKEEEKLDEEFIFINKISKRLGCDIDGDIIRVGSQLYYISANNGILEKIEEE